MIEICQRLFIGNESDYEMRVKHKAGWWIVHACKEPYHRQLLGYKGRGAPKDHPEYLIARRDNRLIVNLVDADDPAYIPKQIFDECLVFIETALNSGGNVLVHCNQGESRSPSIGFLYLVVHTDILPKASFEAAETSFLRIYPAYRPKGGMRGFLRIYWDEYTNLE